MASEKLFAYARSYIKNPLAKAFINQLIKSLGINYIGQFINEFKFPSSDEILKRVKFIVKCDNLLLKPLVNRKIWDLL